VLHKRTAANGAYVLSHSDESFDSANQQEAASICFKLSIQNIANLSASALAECPLLKFVLSSSHNIYAEKQPIIKAYKERYSIEFTNSANNSTSHQFVHLE